MHMSVYAVVALEQTKRSIIRIQRIVLAWPSCDRGLFVPTGRFV